MYNPFVRFYGFKWEFIFLWLVFFEDFIYVFLQESKREKAHMSGGSERRSRLHVEQGA